MTDVISRADAICEVLVNDGIENIVDRIKALPSADAEWIKVTEDTPPEFPCLVCDANGNQPFVTMGIVTITDEEHGEWHIDGRLWVSPKVFVDGEWGNQISYGNRIIAWMPLPKPYREDGEA